jgi:asparagine synthetase B (glutamine-hydrolysing)
MFDIYGVVDLYEKRRTRNINNPFKKYEYYDFDYFEHSLITDNASIFYLERVKMANNYFGDGRHHVFVFGSVFSNQEFCELFNDRWTRRLCAKDVFGLYQKQGSGLVHFIKGSFVIIFYDEQQNRIMVISDHLNVLPIYYAHQNGILLFSSAIKPILDSSLVNCRVDKTAMAEFAIFDYPLGDRTLYNAIRAIGHGCILVANQKGLDKQKYFSVSDLFQDKLLSEVEAVEILSEILKDNSRLYVADTDKFLLALTGGFDCRMNLALNDRQPEDYLCFSYGMPGSKQLEIPAEIARRLKLNYVAVVLDDSFEKEYEDCALRSLFYSDGTAPILRANYPYAFRRLNQFSDVAMTGLFGSEVMRPIRNLGIQINTNSENVFMSDDFERSLKSAFDHESDKGYIRRDIFDASYDEVRDHFKNTYFSSDERRSNLINLYIFFIGEGVRKYFTQEIRIERVYVETRFPYFDFDFVKAMFHTRYAGLYNGALKESPIGRRNAQSLYAYMIRKYKPVLGQIRNDRGYRPADLLSPVWFLKILPGYIRMKRYYRKKGNDTFAAERWTDLVFSKERELMKKKTQFFPGTLFEKYADKVNITDNYCFSRMFSLKYWFEHAGS